MVPDGSVEVDQGDALLALYDVAVGDVYGYLRRRCHDDETARDLTSETFLAAVDSVKRRRIQALTVAWLIGIARHKLLDHWRRVEREQRRLEVLEREAPDGAWEIDLEPHTVAQAMESLNSAYRAALTFRYVDDLPVREVARLVGRPEQATEALLVRARSAFRIAYESITAEGSDR